MFIIANLVETAQDWRWWECILEINVWTFVILLLYSCSGIWQSDVVKKRMVLRNDKRQTSHVAKTVFRIRKHWYIYIENNDVGHKCPYISHSNLFKLTINSIYYQINWADSYGSLKYSNIFRERTLPISSNSNS